MKTYKIYWSVDQRTGDNLIKATSEELAIAEFKSAYPNKLVEQIINCSTPEYQLAYDNEQFDSNGRRKF